MRFCKMLIYCVKLDHALYSINYGRWNNGVKLTHDVLGLWLPDEKLIMNQWGGLSFYLLCCKVQWCFPMVAVFGIHIAVTVTNQISDNAKMTIPIIA